MTNDYNEKLAQDYSEIKDRVARGMLPLVARVPAIDKATKEYALAQAELYESKRAQAEADGRNLDTVPIPFRDSAALDRFADLILYEELKWSHPDKMSIVEYPVMSDTQEDRLLAKTYFHDELEYKDRESNGRRALSYTDNHGAPKISRNRLPFPYADELEQVDVNIIVHGALENANLTDRQRQAIDLVFFENMTQEEAAEEMGVSRSTLREAITVSLRKLNDYLTIRPAILSD